MLIDTPKDNCGNTNCGNLADNFFGVKYRQNILCLILNQEDRDNFSIMLQMFNVLLRLTQSVDNKKTVDCEKVKNLGIQLMLHIKNNFLNEKGQSWVMIIPTVHALCAHSWEMFQMNEGGSIAKWS